MMSAAVTEHEKTNLFKAGRYQLLKSGVIYGANASGKSNLIKAMSTMRMLVLKSFEKTSTQDLDLTPFMLQSGYETKPSFFEVLFFVNDTRYRYGFEANSLSIKAEWLFEAKKNTEKPLFVRDNDGIQVFPAYKEGRNLEEKTRSNALFLTVVDQFNGATAKTVMGWFNKFVAISGLSHEEYKVSTFNLLENDQTKPILQGFFKNLDLGFDDISIVKKTFDPTELPKNLPESVARQLVTDLEGKMIVNLRTMHKRFSADNKVESNISFDLRSQESSGTNKLINISGPVFDVLTVGGMLAIDELDASLHPLLTLAVTKLFNSSEHNPKNAQLIFSTHDTNLLGFGNFRRDQVYFVEKDDFGATDLYSLVEYKESGKTIRKDRSFEKDYIQGRYGAIPYIGNLNSLLSKWQEK